jgi:hypothetical protein
MARERAGEKIKFASRRNSRQMVTDAFIKSFGSEILDSVTAVEEPELVFKMKCSGWTLNTAFDFGRSDCQIGYCHGLASETNFEHHGTKIPCMLMGSYISFNSWLGISSQTKWSHLMDADVSGACEAMITHCKNFYKIAPQLLNGLEADHCSNG